MKWLKGLEDHPKSGKGEIACPLARYHDSNGVHWSYISRGVFFGLANGQQKETICSFPVCYRES